jgi:hypothetical protein
MMLIYYHYYFFLHYLIVVVMAVDDDGKHNQSVRNKDRSIRRDPKSNEQYFDSARPR